MELENLRLSLDLVEITNNIFAVYEKKIKKQNISVVFKIFFINVPIRDFFKLWPRNPKLLLTLFFQASVSSWINILLIPRHVPFVWNTFHSSRIIGQNSFGKRIHFFRFTFKTNSLWDTNFLHLQISPWRTWIRWRQRWIWWCRWRLKTWHFTK